MYIYIFIIMHKMIIKIKQINESGMIMAGRDENMILLIKIMIFAYYFGSSRFFFFFLFSVEIRHCYTTALHAILHYLRVCTSVIVMDGWMDGWTERHLLSLIYLNIIDTLTNIRPKVYFLGVFGSEYYLR
ncbi:hypothetical protein ACJX0J_038978 [Zea mays]